MNAYLAPGIGDSETNTVAQAICNLRDRQGDVTIADLAEYMKRAEPPLESFQYVDFVNWLAGRGFVMTTGSTEADLVIFNVSKQLKSLIEQAPRSAQLLD